MLQTTANNPIPDNNLMNNDSGDINIEGSKVMLVDDNRTNIDVIKRLLEPEKLDFSMAPNGKVAVENAPVIQPDLILMDVMMPEMNGFEACKLLKENPVTRDIPLFFLTAKNQPSDIEKGFSLGCVDYIAKPFIGKEVLARVVVHLKAIKHAKLMVKLLEELKRSNMALEQKVVERTAVLKKAKEEAELANNSKTRFLSRMGQELQAPLNVILGFSQSMETHNLQPLTDEQCSCLEKIQIAGEYFQNLINDISDLGRIESGNLIIGMEEFPLSRLVDERVLPAISSLARERGVTIENQIPSEHSTFIFVDPIRAAQALVNLLTNAINYNKNGGNIYLERNFLESGKIKIIVSDTGIGIPEDKLKEIFEPFIRLQNHDFKVEGVGIGLTIAKHLIESMKGEIEVESEMGKGSRFGITLHGYQK